MWKESQVKEDFAHARELFAKQAADWGVPALDRFFWYHTIELEPGVVTPGNYDYRETIRDFHFPKDLHGKTVLDIGSATGYFAFEFERRGATVTSVELPSLFALDRFPGQTVEQSIAKIQRMMFDHEPDHSSSVSPEEMYFYLLEGPFRFCAERLGSKAKRVYSSIYDLSLEKLGAAEPFDLIFIGDVLLHTLNPLLALAKVAPLCRGRLIVAQGMPELPGGESALVYVGGSDPIEDEVSWWHPTKEWFLEIFCKLGFSHVFEAGKHRGLLMPAAYPFERTVIHALR